MGAYTGTIPTLPAGRKVPATDWLEIYNALSALTTAWTDYAATFTITSQTSTDPTQGNSIYEARYRQLGKTVDAVFRVTIGSTFTVGAGAYRFRLPVAAVDKGVGKAWVKDSGTASYAGICRVYLASNPYVEIWLPNATGAALGAAGPGTAWANGDVIEAQICYETL